VGDAAVNIWDEQKKISKTAINCGDAAVEKFEFSNKLWGMQQKNKGDGVINCGGCSSKQIGNAATICGDAAVNI